MSIVQDVAGLQLLKRNCFKVLQGLQLENSIEQKESLGS